MKQNKTIKTIFAAVMMLLVSTGLSFGQIFESFVTTENLKNLEDEGFNINLFDKTTSGLITNRSVYVAEGGFIRSPYVFLQPGTIEFFVNGRLSNVGSLGSFSAILSIFNLQNDLVAQRSQALEPLNSRIHQFRFSITIKERGFYRLDVSHEVERRNNGQDPTWTLSSFLVDGSALPRGSRFVREPWLGRSSTNISLASGNRSYIVGEDVELEYSSGFETSDDRIRVSKANFDISLPEGIVATEYSLFINSQLIAVSADLREWKKLEKKGFQDISMTLNRGLKEQITITNFSHNDQIKLVVKGKSKKSGSFPFTITLTEGWASEKENVTTNSIVSFSTTSTQNEPNIPSVSSTSNLEIIPFGTTPVELISFSVDTKGQFPAISWSTALEINNDFFTIERSADGRNFHKIGTVDGKGDFSGISEYQFLDRAPLRGTAYYRLVQTDFDGTTKTFDAHRAVFNREITADITVLKNPSTRENIQFTVQGMNDSPSIQVTLVDMNGKVISRQMVQNSSQEVISMEGLSLTKGIYVLNVATQGQRIAKRVLVD